MKMLDVPQSGSIAGVTSSRNRFGQYKRSRSIPVNPNSTKQSQMRARFGQNTIAWRALTDLQRAGWKSLGDSITRTDSLGQAYTLTGQQAYILVNNNELDAGNAISSDAPAIAAPVGLLTATITLTAAAFSIAFTATPTAAGARVFAYCSPQRSAGRGFEGDYRLIEVSTAAKASPFDIFTTYSSRFGTPVVGNKVFISLQVFLGGFLSAPLLTSKVVS